MPNEEVIAELARRVPGLEIDLAPSARAGFARDASGLEGVTPLAVVRPRSTSEIERLVNAARTVALRLVPVSSTGEHHRGDTLCAERTAVVDLSRLKRIVRVDRRNRVVLFEAGVTFAELNAATQREGLRALLPLAPRPGKSALAAYLEREPIIYPRFQWDMSDPLLCTEVVFGTGELFRTGSAAGPGTIEEQWAAGDAQKNPMGPGQSDLVRLLQGAQGTVGIVSWCSAKCEPVPSGEMLHLVAAQTMDPLLHVARGLLRRRQADILFLACGRTLAALLAGSADEVEAASRGAQPWYLVYSLAEPAYLPEDKLRFVGREIADLCAAVGVRSIQPPRGTEEELLARLTRPEAFDSRPHWKRGGREATREVFFQTTLSRAPQFVSKIRSILSSHGRRPDDALYYVQPQLGGRCAHVEVILPHAREDQPRVEALAGVVAREVRSEGAFFSRPYGPWVDLAFKGSSTAWIVPKVKSIFDPDGILAPGRLDVSSYVGALGALEGEPRVAQ